MKSKIKKFIEIVRQIKMTEEENQILRVKIATVAKNDPIEKAPLYFKVPSPYFSRFSFKVTSKIVGFALLFVVLGASGITYVSASALPGDFLYPVKIAKENLAEKFVSTPQERIALKQKRINTRFNEVETLIKEKKITPENRSIADTKIQEDTVAIGNDIEEINKNNPQAVIAAKTTLNASIAEHQEKINSLIKQSASDTSSTSVSTDGSNKDNTTPDETDFDGEININIGTNPSDIIPSTTDSTTSNTTTSSNTSIDTGGKSTSDPSKTNTINTDTSVLQNVKVAPSSTGTNTTTSTTNNVNDNSTTHKKAN
jgi:hypothetical protein